jgi:hypothetical protein
LNQVKVGDARLKVLTILKEDSDLGIRLTVETNITNFDKKISNTAAITES